MSWIVQAALGGVFALGACLAWDLARANLRHGHHEATPAPELAHEPDFYGSMFVDEFTKGLAERYEMVDPAPWERVAREWHGYIPELDPGPQAPAGAPGPDQTGDRVHRAEGSPEQNTASAGLVAKPAVMALNGAPGNRDEAGRDAGESSHHADLGPRACAVLAAYEGRRGARKWATT